MNGWATDYSDRNRIHIYIEIFFYTHLARNSAGGDDVAGKTLRLRIKTAEPSLSAKESSIASFILDNPRQASRMTISEMAETLGMADSTIFKFTRKLGYKGFRDFRNALLSEGFDPEVSIHENISESSTPLQMAESVFDSTIKSLTDTKALLSEEAFSAAASMINGCQRLSFYGMGGSNVVAADAYHKFLRTPIHVHHDADFHMQLMSASRSHEGDVAICISHSGLCRQTLEIADKLRENSVGIISITSNPASPLARRSAVSLITMADETAYRSESLASRIAQLALIDSLYTIVMFSNEESSREALSEIREAIATTRVNS